MLKNNVTFKKGDAVTILTKNLTEIVGRLIHDIEGDIHIAYASRITVQAATKPDGSAVYSYEFLVKGSNDPMCIIDFSKEDYITIKKANEKISDTLPEIKESDNG